ncbi:MAG TPA: 50S ribosomal protein L21 [Clostridiales bacterium]|jgi:large subunit ribosomal protein L21|nr:50S ribosomal protein L21 [Clostridiales bacterium]
MYAIIRTGGKQYRVQEGDVINIEKLNGQPGDMVTFEEVLAVGSEDGIKIGTPVLQGAKVDAKVLGHGKGKKIIVYKYKAKKGYRRKQGHRQPFTRVEISKINCD